MVFRLTNWNKSAIELISSTKRWCDFSSKLERIVFVQVKNCMQCWHLTKLLWKVSMFGSLMRRTHRNSSVIYFSNGSVEFLSLSSLTAQRLRKREMEIVPVFFSGLLSTSALEAIVFEKHLSVLNFIRQVNKYATDYWMCLQVSILNTHNTF